MPASPNDWALSFNGTSNRVTFPTTGWIRNLTSFTIEAWVKPDLTVTNGSRRCFWMQQGGGYKLTRFAIVAIKDLLRFELGTKDGKADTNYNYKAKWSADRWHHVAFVANVSGETYHMYLNGQEVATGTLIRPSDLNKVSDTAPQRVYAGAVSTDGSTFTFGWAGKIDEIRVWGDARTQAEIADNRFLHVADTADNLIECWRFNEGTGVTVSGLVDSDTGTPGTQLRTANLQASAMWTTDRPFLGDTDGDGDADFDTTAPSNPSAPTVTTITANSFHLDWGTSTDAVYVQGYQLAVATDSAFLNHVSGYANKDVGVVTAYDVEGLVPATNYYARVRAFDAEDNFSSWVNCTTFPITTNTAGDVDPPSAPVALSASAVTYLGFTANWDLSTDSGAGATGVAGYKLDVAYDEDFTQYVTNFRNIDVGNVSHYPVTTGDWDTTYYYRVRAYDGAENESDDSNTVTVTTSPPPDTTPPNAVILQDATGVGSSVFTANWEEGEDNVAVTGYYLDVSTDEAFASYVAGFQYLDVGNVTAYAVEGLDPETVYYYRVYARDAAANVGPTADAPTKVVTTPQTVAEGDPLSHVLNPTADTYVDASLPLTPLGSNPSLAVAGDGSSTTKIAYLKFDLTDVIGTVQDATLRLFVTDASLGTLTVYGPLTDAWDDTTTWTTRPALAGDTVNFTPLNDEDWVDVPIMPLLTEGNAVYSFAIVSIDGDAAAFSASDAGTNLPELLIEVDPNDGTQTSDLTLDTEPLERKNWLLNGSAEGTLTDTVEAHGSATVVSDATHVYHGASAAKATTTASGVQGVAFKTEAALGLTGTVRSFAGAVELWADTPVALDVFLRFYYTDATNTTGPISDAVYVQAGWTRVEVGAHSTDAAKTLDYIELIARTDTAQISTFWADAAIVEEASSVGTYFDGNTVIGGVLADWDGAQNASSSTIKRPTIAVAASFIGDGDEDNAATVRVKRGTADVSDWVTPPSANATINRVANQAEATIGPSYRLNLAKNPSAEVGLSGYAAETSTIGQDTTEFFVGAASVAVAVTGADQGVLYRDAIRALATEDYAVRAAVKVPSGIDVCIAIVAYDASGAELSDSGEGDFVSGNDDWQQLTTTWTLPASTAELGVRVKTTSGSTVAGTFYVDAIGIAPGDVVQPYIDGSVDDGLWEGEIHASETWYTLTPDVEYDVEVTFTDADGVLGVNPVSGRVTAAKPPDNAITVTTMELTTTNTTLTISIPYEGDDDEDATVVLKWKREDLASYSSVTPVWDRDDKVVTATVRDLNPGTSYEVLATFSDSTAVYGVNPLNVATSTRTDSLLPEIDPKITFGGFVLNGDDGKIYVTEHDGFGLPKRDIQIEPLARIDGEVELQQQWRRRVIKIKGVVEGDSRAELFGNLDALKQALAKAQQPLVMDTMTRSRRYYTATCSSFASVEVGQENMRHLVWDAEFTAADPFAYSASETVDRDNSVTNGDTLVVLNDGNVLVEPQFRLTVGGSTNTTVTISNETTGERITPSVTFKSGDIFLIDSALQSCRKNGVEVDFLGGFPRLAVGANTLKFTCTPTDRTLTVQVRRRHRWI